ncbi:MAG: hypothetical protein ISP49_04040 [Reyranella sp.]|nr:hypothetical protein [Reyranella sp.]
MREPRSEQAREKRELAALIRRYAAGLEDADRKDLTAHADSIEAEAGALDKAHAYGTLKARTDAVFDALLEALKAMDDPVPDFYSGSVQGHDVNRTAVRIAHLSGAPEARYLVHGLGSRLELHVQLNVYRLAVVYRIPAQRDLDSAALQTRFARWTAGAAGAGWTIGWREACDEVLPAIEVLCRAGRPIDFLQDERHQLYWITELVQMTRAFLLEARRTGVELAAA